MDMIGRPPFTRLHECHLIDHVSKSDRIGAYLYPYAVRQPCNIPNTADVYLNCRIVPVFPPGTMTTLHRVTVKKGAAN